MILIVYQKFTAQSHTTLLRFAQKLEATLAYDDDLLLSRYTTIWLIRPNIKDYSTEYRLLEKGRIIGRLFGRSNTRCISNLDHRKINT